MSAVQLFFLIVLFFVTSAIGVVTGGNSLITVPVMFELGIDEKTAVATNMFGLTFMAIGGAIPFVRKGDVNFRKISPMIVLTIIGSAIGAAIVGLVSNEAMKLIVTVGMIAVVLFIVITGNGRRKKAGTAEAQQAPATDNEQTRSAGRIWPVVGYVAVFSLAIYGGLYSGGYVTILTAVLIAFFGMTYAGSIAATKLLNVFSSSIATAVFIYQGLVNFRLGAVLAVSMFAGAYVGAHYATKMPEIWLRRIFLSAVVLLAAKAVIDFIR